jgi:transposase
MNVITIGFDLAKTVFQVHGVDRQGAVVLRRQLRRQHVERFFAKLPPCLVGMEACGTAHHWARRLRELGHEVRLIPPAYAKAYVRRNKTDAADAAAICEAVGRPSMSFVPVKSVAQQAIASVHRVREALVQQRTKLANMIRGQMAEFGIVVRRGMSHVAELLARLAEPGAVPEMLRRMLLGLGEALAMTDQQIKAADREILSWHKENECSQRLASIPGFGPIASSAMAARVVQPTRFKSGRYFAAWLGLVPKQASSGGKVRLGGISKRGDVYLRRLLVNGAQSVLIGRHGCWRTSRAKWRRSLWPTRWHASPGR